MCIYIYMLWIPKHCKDVHWQDTGSSMFTTIHSFPFNGCYHHALSKFSNWRLRALFRWSGGRVTVACPPFAAAQGAHKDEASSICRPCIGHLIATYLWSLPRGKVALTLSFAGSWRGRAASVISQSQYIYICDVTWCDVMWCYVMLWNVMLCNVMYI
jgi:hypothetical protein